MGNPVVEGGYASPQSIYSTTTTKVHRLGSKGTLDDRLFRYARLTDTNAIGIGKLAQMAVPAANHVSETGTLTGFTVGRTSFTAVLGATAAHANMYEDGYIKIESSTLGPGQLLKLRGHAAISSAGTGSFELYDPVVTTPTGTVTWSLIRNPWADIVIMPTTATAPAAGVVSVDWAAASTTAPLYGWVQSVGPAAGLIDTADVVVGTGLTPSAAVAGSFKCATLDGNAATSLPEIIAVAMETIATNSIHASIFLRIE
jgi:hypothetical protein